MEFMIFANFNKDDACDTNQSTLYIETIEAPNLTEAAEIVAINYKIPEEAEYTSHGDFMADYSWKNERSYMVILRKKEN